MNGTMHAMSITLDEVRHVARLARLELPEPEMVALQGELNALIGHFSDIAGTDVTGIDPLAGVSPLVNVMADDVPSAALPRDLALRSGALTRAGLFVVPLILED